MTYGDHTHHLNTSPMPVWLSNQPNQWNYQPVPSHSHTVSGQFVLTNPIKEPEMTAAEKIAKERREAREKREAEAFYNDIVQVIEVEVGHVLAWSERDSERAAIYNADGWRITGFTSVFATESLIAYLIDHDAGTIGPLR